ncbi:MAG TPA: hypothetical protein VLA79_14955, partial [Polyangia bacterium]|nr:hypothetical protein [Polyangia bacterium]
RFQSAADMASDLERTLIAARYSSRELSKLLHGLFLPDEDPLVVVDTGDGQTVAITSAGTGTGTHTGTSSGSRTGSGSRSGSSGSRPAAAPGAHSTALVEPDTSLTEPIPEVADVVKRRADSGAQRLERVLRAEQGRLARARFRVRARIFATAAGVALLVGAAIWAGHRYLPALLASPPAPPPALPVTLPNQAPPAPAAKPAPKKHPAAHSGPHSARKKGAAAAGSGEATPTAPAGDDSASGQPQ